MKTKRFVHLGVLAVALISRAATAQATPQLFDFHDDFWVNLHQFLHIVARAQAGRDARRPATIAALGDTTGIGALTPSARAEFDSALAYYAKVLANRDALFDSTMVRINNQLSTTGAVAAVRGSGIDTAVARALDRAAPAYRAVWWPRHDASNRRWIGAVTPLLTQHGDSAARWEARLFHTSWPRGIRSDVSAYATWSGAYTTENPGHITLATVPPGNDGLYAFEMLFHEVLHTMDETVRDSAIAAFRAVGKRAPRDVTHPMIFYTAGELTRRIVSPNHVPYADKNGLWAIEDWAHMRPLLQVHWQRYIDGTISLTEALRAIVQGW